MMLEKEQLDRLIASSLFSDRIGPLRAHTEWGRKPLNYGQMSNCCGTVIYVIKAEHVIWRIWGRFVNEGVDFGDAVYFPTELPRTPGYVGRRAMKEFLYGNGHVREAEKENAKDSIVAFSPGRGSPPLHCGVYLGQIDGQDVMFHQDHAGVCFETLRVGEYLERTFPAELRGLLSVTYHKFER